MDIPFLTKPQIVTIPFNRPYVSLRKSITCLSPECIDRILVYRFLADNKTFKHILPFILCCKSLYHNHLHLIYTLGQVHISITDKSNAISSLQLHDHFKTKTKFKITNIVFDLTPRYKINIQNLNLIKYYIPRFKYLTTVTIRINCFEFLQLLYHLPLILKSLTLVVTTRINYSTNFQIDLSKIPKFTLEKLKFETRSPLSLSRLSKFFPLIKDPLSYEWLAIDEEIPEATVGSPMDCMCDILGEIIYRSHATIREIGLKNIHIVFVFRKLNSYFFPSNTDTFVRATLQNERDENLFPKLIKLGLDNVYQMSTKTLLKLIGARPFRPYLLLTEHKFLQEILLVRVCSHKRITKQIFNRSEYNFDLEDLNERDMRSILQKKWNL